MIFHLWQKTKGSATHPSLGMKNPPVFSLENPPSSGTPSNDFQFHRVQRNRIHVAKVLLPMPSTLGVSMVGGVCWRSSIHSNTSEMGKKWSFFVFHTSSPSKIVIIWSPKSDRVRLQTDQLWSPESSQRNDLQPSIVVQPGKLSSMYPKKGRPR